MNTTSPRDAVTRTSVKSFAKSIVASGALRFAGWWSIFAGALALYSVCPVCGNAGCPVGIGVTGVLAGLLAALKQWGSRILGAIVGMVRPSHRSRVGECDECCGENARPSHDHHGPCKHHHNEGKLHG